MWAYLQPSCFLFVGIAECGWHMQKAMPLVHEALEGSPLTIKLRGVVRWLTHALYFLYLYVTKPVVMHSAFNSVILSSMEPWNFC